MPSGAVHPIWSAVNFRVWGREPLDDGGVLPVDRVLATLHPDDQARVKAELAAALARDEPFQSEFRIVTAAGTTRWLAGRGRVVPGGASDAPRRMVGINLDLTDRRLADAARLANEEHLRLAMEACALSTFDLDLARDRAVRSAQHDVLFGYDAPEPDWGFAIMLRHVVEGDRPAVERSFNDAVETCRPWRQRFRVHRADDASVRWIEVHGLPARGADGRPVRLRGVITDVTEHEQAAQELRRLNETLEVRVEQRTRERDRLWRNSLDLLAVIGADGTIQAANPAWTETLGYRVEGLIGLSIDSLIHPDDVEPAHQAIRTCISGDQPLRSENRFRHRDGAWHWLSWTAAAAEDRRIYAVARDITAEKDAAAVLQQTEDALRQSQKMEAVGQLTGGIAHDFNNLLTAVVGNLELIAQNPGDSGRVRRLAGLAREAAMRGAKLTGQLLAFSRTQRLAVAPVDVNALASGMEDLIARSVAPLARVQLSLHPAAGAALADANQLELAILNLAINARDAMPDGGTVLVSTGSVAWPDRPGSELPAGDYVEISVTDTGEGMSDAVRQRAFEPFFTTKPKGHGTGLGLAQVYGITRQVGGTAQIDSVEGQGTTVRLLLPRAPNTEQTGLDGASAEAIACQARTQEARAATLLVVDDDPDVRALMAETLSTLGYRVLVAESGEAALRLLEGERPDLLLVDYAMPGLNGADVARAALTRFPGLPIAFATGYSDSDALDSVRGDASVLRKPFTVSELKDVLARLLDKPGGG